MKLYYLFFILITVNSFGQTVVKQIKPSTTDPLMSTFDSESYVYINQSVAAKNLLVIHLPGSYGKPNRATYFGELAADLGFHSIGLSYPNIPTVASLCSGSADSSSYENLRREVVTGYDYSSDISVDSTNCILNRARKLLMYLDATYSSENWGQFLDTNNELDYSKIIFSGHSQGGGHAAIIAKYYPLKRVLCFSAPKDYSSYFHAPAFWLSSGTWQTPNNEIYAFVHTLDHYGRQLEILENIGLSTYGVPVNVDSNSSPYNKTLQLSTSYSVQSGDEHGSTVVDNNTPVVSGSPVFLPVWTYMLTNNITTGLSANLSLDEETIKVYPNPTSGQLNFQFGKIPTNFEVSIFTTLGEKIVCIKDKTVVDISHFVNGVYFMEVKADHKVETIRIIKTN